MAYIIVVGMWKLLKTINELNFKNWPFLEVSGRKRNPRMPETISYRLYEKLSKE